MANIRIPTPLRQFTDGNASVIVSGDTVGAALNDLTNQFPSLRHNLYEGEKLRSFVNIYLGQDDIRYLEGESTKLAATDTLLIVPSIAGGHA